ncbi:hypothetical protein BDF20DRAFT_909099 [Mycotypha africana]|uniref:uncharacterized protein n=1 Tax=Mycotypha africana TaxID=64632 RepID=UPI0023017004|nr:uncharacterized protein BDF20DRAFT_909099 [Mycotypha africana]KAI8991298.1 hypothetical protein BDF20DRAFT_909099 [Mycotypha africana]
MDIFKKTFSWNREKKPGQQKSRFSLISNSKKLQQSLIQQQEQHQKQLQDDPNAFLPRLTVSTTYNTTNEIYTPQDDNAITPSILKHQSSLPSNQFTELATQSSQYDTKSDTSFNTVTTTTDDSLLSLHSHSLTPVSTSTSASVLMVDAPPRQQSKQVYLQRQKQQLQQNHPNDQISINTHHRPKDDNQPSNANDENKAKETDIESIEDDYIVLGMKYHEKGETEKATYCWRLASNSGSSLGMFFYGIALRHGWGCKKEPNLAVQYLQQAAEFAVYDLQVALNVPLMNESSPQRQQQQLQKAQLPILQPTRSTLSSLSSSSSRSTRRVTSPAVAKSELILAIYELGVCFKHGWGVPKNLETAACYFQIAANLGDPDAQNDLGFCYYNGIGVKKDNYCAAKYFRLAERQGQGMMGNSWIWKDKYNIVDNPEWKPGMTITDMRRMAKKATKKKI